MVANILYIDVSAKFGGTITSLLSRLKHMDRDRFMPLVICRAGPQADAFQRLDVETEVISAPGFARSSFTIGGVRSYNPLRILRHILILMAVLRAALRLFRDGGFDIIHGSALYSNLYASIVGLVFRKPVVWHINDFTMDFQKKLHRFLSKRAMKVITISKAVHEYVLKSYGDKTRIVLIHQPIDSREFSPMDRAEARRQLGLDLSKRIVGFVGRLDRDKGVDQFLLVGSKVLKSHANSLFVIAGDARDKEYLAVIQGMIRQLKLQKSVILLGLRRDIPVLMNALDVLVFTAIAPEPFGRVLAEASACAIPIIATDVGAVREIVEHNETGVVIHSGDIESLAKGVSSLLEDPDRAERMGRAARERVKALFSPDSHERKLEKLYEEILS